MRIAGLGGEVIRKLGAEPVLLPPAEIVPAMKSGAVDAAEWVGPWLDLAFGLHETARYVYMPAFHEPGPTLEIVVNRDAYDTLPDDPKAIVAAAAYATSVQTLAEFQYNNVVSLRALEEKGAVVRSFPDDVVKALGLAAAEVLGEIAVSNPAAGKVHASYLANPAAGKVHASYLAFLRQAVPYSTAMTGEMFRHRALVLGT